MNQIIASGGGTIQLGKTIGSKEILPEKGGKVDILFVIDTTGSMDDKIEALLNTCKQFVDEARKLELDPQFALVSFGDIKVVGGGDTIDIVVPLTGDIERIKYGLTNIPRNSGFGNGGESCLEALEKALTITCRKGTVKVAILITDDDAHQYHISAANMTKILKQKEYLVYVVATAKEYYKYMASQTGGFWRNVDDTRNLNDILDMFKNMAKKVAQTATIVHQSAGGSVSKYLQLNPPKDN